MVYLDYLLYIVLIVLFYILMEKILYNENKEGFEHRGKGFIASKPKKVKNEDEDKEEPDSNWLISIKLFYRIAADVAIMLIKMPYKFLSKGVNMLTDFINELNEMLKPMYAFVKQMGKIVQRIVVQIYEIFKRTFTQVFDIMRNLPAFIQKYANMGINFINTMVTKTVDMLTNFFNMFQSMLNQILEIPNQIFNIVEQLTQFMFNSFTMMMNLPITGLKFGINMQNKMTGFMNKQ